MWLFSRQDEVSHFRHGVILLVLAVVLPGGCHPSARRLPFDPVPMADAVRIVNANLARIPGTLRAVGPVDGHFTTPRGVRHSFHLRGVLFFLAPNYFRFDLKSFGDRQMLFGSNEGQYWLYSKQDDQYYCGWHDEPDDLPPEMPVRPEQMVDALGLGGISVDGRERVDVRVVQRVVEQYQQILFLARDDASGRFFLEREYWLDRYRPRLLRRVVFRDADGVVEMTSRLDDYRRLSPEGPLLPGVVIADWPATGTRLRFRARSWRFVEQVTPHSVQFSPPAACRK